MPLVYTPLRSEKSEIRLLEIVSLGDDAISCRLSIVSLQEKPVFAALSYFWGDPLAVKDIIVDGRAVSVTENLWAALRHVKSSWVKHFPDREPSTFRLWADALCINQHDMSERSS